MNINITTQNVNLTDLFNAVENDGEITLHDAGAYGLTITSTDDGYTVTDETGGDQGADTFKQALTIAAEFIEHVADEDADWMALATEMRHF